MNLNYNIFLNNNLHNIRFKHFKFFLISIILRLQIHSLKNSSGASYFTQFYGVGFPQTILNNSYFGLLFYVFRGHHFFNEFLLTFPYRQITFSLPDVHISHFHLNFFPPYHYPICLVLDVIVFSGLFVICKDSFKIIFKEFLFLIRI